MEERREENLKVLINYAVDPKLQTHITLIEIIRIDIILCFCGYILPSP